MAPTAAAKSADSTKSFASLLDSNDRAKSGGNGKQQQQQQAAPLRVRRKTVDNDNDDDDDNEQLRGAKKGLSMSGAEMKQVQDNEALDRAIAASRSAKRRISRVHGRAEELCTKLFDAHVAGQADFQETSRLMADEYAKTARLQSSEGASSSIHERFIKVVREFRHMARFELTGQQERVAQLRSAAETVEQEVYRRTVDIAISWLDEELPEALVEVSERTVVDLKAGMIVQRWGHSHEAAKHSVKALSRFANLALNEIAVPLVVVAEVCGLCFVGWSIAPIAYIVTNPLKSPEFRFAIEAALSELHKPVEVTDIVRGSLFAVGSDGLMYCMLASSIVPLNYGHGFLNLLDTTQPHDDATLDAQLLSRMDHVAVEAVAVARSNFAHVSKALHRHGLRVKHLNLLHAYLSRQETIREDSIAAAVDHNLASALVACVAEILARVIKAILRRLWADNISDKRDMSAQDKAIEMGIYANQLVNLLVVEGHPTRTQQHMQLFTTLAQFSYKLLPRDPKAKKSDMLWDEDFVSETHIASRVAHMTGMTYSHGVIAGTSLGRLVRAVRLAPRDVWLEVNRGRHQDVMKRIVAQIKAARTQHPQNAFHLTVHLADIFHVAQGRAGVTRRPADLFDQAAWMSGQKRRELRESGNEGEDDGAADDPYANHRQLQILRCLALQGLHTLRQEVTVAEQVLRERQAAMQASNMVQQARTPMQRNMTPLDGHLDNSAASGNGMLGAGPAAAKGITPAGTPRQEGMSAIPTKIPQSAQYTHGQTVAAVHKYIDLSMQLCKQAQASIDEADPHQARVGNARVLSEVLRRAEVLALAATILHDKKLFDYVDLTMNALDRLRNAGHVDPKLGFAWWSMLFDASTEALLQFDGEAALAASRRKLKHVEDLFGDDSMQVGVVHTDIGATLLQLGRNEAGREAFELGFRHFCDVAPKSTATFTAANNLGYTYFRLAERKMDPTARKRRHGFLRMALPPPVLQLLDEAESAFKFVIDNREVVETTTLADVMNNLGSVHTFRGRYSLAVPLFEETLLLTRGILSDEHPDRASAIRNLKTCERRMKSNAALWITCMFRRFQARKQLQLLRKGAVHVAVFQRIGRAYAARMKVYQLSEYRKIRNIGRNVNNNFGGGDYYATANVALDDDDDDTLPVGQPASNASPADNATPTAKDEARANNEMLPGALAESDSDDDGAAAKGAAPAGLSWATMTPSMRASLIALQAAGRGCLNRNMVRKIWKFRQKKARRK